MSTNIFQIVYDGLRENNEVLSITNTQKTPQVLIKPNHGGKLYTLLMSDPDAAAKSWLHWLVVNIPSSSPNMTEGDEVISYAPPSPPSGIHRYIFTLYEQPASILVSAPNERGNFNVDAFERKYNLKKIKSSTIRVPA